MKSARSGSRDWTTAAVVCSILFVVVLNTVPIASNDLWLQCRMGQLIVDHGSIPTTLLFPFTPIRDAPFQAHEWLPSVLFHFLMRLFGIGGLMFVQGAFGLVQFALAYRLARTLCGSIAIALALGATAMLLVNYRYVLRPELIALLLFTALLSLLVRARDQRRPAVLLWTFPLAVLWANCHGSFLLGPALATIFAVGEGLQAAFDPRGAPSKARLRSGSVVAWPYAGAAVAMLAAATINPLGVALLRFAFHLQSSDAMRTTIKEWLPTIHPQFVASPAFWIFVLACVGTCALVVASWRLLTVTDALLLATFGALAWSTNRHIVWFAIVDLAVCARLLGASSGHWAHRESPLRAMTAALALCGVVACLALGNTRQAYLFDAPSNNFTAPMTAQLADPALVGNVYNSYELGSELIFRAWPRLKPSIDSRVDAYGDAYLLGHQRLLVDERAMAAFLSEERVDHMLLLRRDFEHSVRDMASLATAWHVRFADEKMLLLERNEPLLGPRSDTPTPPPAAR